MSFSEPAALHDSDATRWYTNNICGKNIAWRSPESIVFGGHNTLLVIKYTFFNSSG
jgi:hypothetical protein